MGGALARALDLRHCQYRSRVVSTLDSSAHSSVHSSAPKLPKRASSGREAAHKSVWALAAARDFACEEEQQLLKIAIEASLADAHERRAERCQKRRTEA